MFHQTLKIGIDKPRAEKETNFMAKVNLLS